MSYFDLEKLAMQYRIECLTAMYRAGSGHTGSSMSVMDILVALYHRVLEDHDHVVLSQGYAAPALYTVLANFGFFPKEDLARMHHVDSKLQGYPTRDVPGVSVTSGSLGQGFSSALGMALALKMDDSPGRVFAILDDAELQEGLVWEAAMCAAHYKANNLVAIIDHSGLQGDGTVHKVMEVEPIHAKFTAFGWRVFHAVDGHDYGELLPAFDNALNGKVNKERPAVIIAKTIKGKGVPFAEQNPSYNRFPLSREELGHVVPQLQEQLERLSSKLAGKL